MSMATEACVGLCKCGNKASVGLCMALLCYVWPGAMQACVVFVSQCRLVHGYAGLCRAVLDYDQLFTSTKNWE